MTARLRCDYCKRNRPLGQILRRFRGLGPTLFICLGCKDRHE